MKVPSPETEKTNAPEENVGTIVSVRGSVIDARFLDRLPDRQNVLVCGERREVVIEVQSHLSRDLVRGLALTPAPGHGSKRRSSSIRESR